MRKLATLCALMLLLASSALAAGSFETLPFGGSFFGGSIKMSSDGQVLAGVWGNAYYWTEAGGMVAIPIGASSPPTIDISGDGSTIIGALLNPDDDKNHAATFDIADFSWTFLDDLPNGEGCDASFSSGWGSNFDASIVAGMAWIPGCDAEATKWVDGVPEALGRFEPTSSRASAIADDSSLLGGWAEHPSFGMRRPAIWTDDVQGPQLIADPENDAGEVFDVSPDGSAVVGVRNTFAFYYDVATASFSEIGSLYDDFWGSKAFGISGEGTVVGQSGDPFFSTPYAFIWTEEMGITYLGDYLTAMGVQGYDGEWLYGATDISNDGRTITGLYVNLDDYLIYPFIVHIEDVVPAALSSFDFEVSPGQVDFRFLLYGDATAADLTLTATKDGVQWDVPVTGAGGDFVARDASAQLLAGGEVRYALCYREGGDLQLLRSENVDLGNQVLADRLLGAFPNPFNPKTAVSFTLGETQRVQMTVFDLAGRRIATLADETFPAGRHSVEWNGRDAAGSTVASGVYFVQLAARSGSQMQKLTLLK